MADVVAANIENTVRTLSETKGLRPSEFFYDYDRLRSGFVTENQFFRVLWENYGFKLTPQEEQIIANKYRLRGDEKVNYKFFCDVIQKPFNPHNMSGNPAGQTTRGPELLGTSRSIRPLSDPEEARLERFLRQLSQYYKYRGINLRTICEDFDKHHLGVINLTQFYRSFILPPEAKEEDVELVARKYTDGSREEQVNYLNVHNDIAALALRIEEEKKVGFNSAPSADSNLPNQPKVGPNVDELLDRIRIVVHKNGIRTSEFFKDFDGLRSGIITEAQFKSGLLLSVGTEAKLNADDLQILANFYATDDGRANYRAFTNLMENAFTIPNLEKKPLQEVIRPPVGGLGRNLKVLSDGEEARLKDILSHMAADVKKRRLMMYQYFKDYDRSKAYSRIITANQFARMLHFISLEVAPQDFKILCRKFEDVATGDINYPAFVQSVDQDFLNYKQDEAEEAVLSSDLVDGDTEQKRAEPAVIGMADLMARLRHHALSNRRRVIEFFQDYDPLRCGHITRARFQRGLSDFGCSSIGAVNLSQTQFDILADQYSHPTISDHVLWTRFVDDVESVFTQNNLEKHPTHRVPPQEIFRVPNPGTMDWRYATEDHVEWYNRVMTRLSQRASERRILAKPVFQDFDRHKRGHITRQQFRQGLTMLELHTSEDEMKTLEAKYCNDHGFNYMAFLKDLQPEKEIKPMYQQRLQEVRETNAKSKVPEHSPATDLQSLLFKIKNLVFRERARIHEWMKDYDKLRSGRMLKVNFRRALDLCKFGLQESEFDILEDHYGSAGIPDHVDYQRFSDDIEALFTTKNLEKAPLLETVPYVPPVDWTLNKMHDDEHAMCKEVLGRIAEKVRARRIQLFPLFEDFDRVNNGRVSQPQFRRVLEELDLASAVSKQKEWECLWKCFRDKVGTREDVNYIAFCDTVYSMGNFEHRKP